MRSFFTKQPLLKLISLVVGFSLWFFVHGEQKGEASIEVPVEWENKPEDLMIIEPYDNKVSLRLVGPRTRLQRIKQDSLKPYSIDLSAAKRGMKTYWIHEEDFQLPFGVSVKRVVPQILRMQFEQANKYEIAVSPSFVNELPEGLRLKSFVVTPAKVQVRASARALKGVKHLLTEPIDLSVVDGSFSRFVSLAAVDFVSDIETKKVNVVVEVEEKEIVKNLGSLPLELPGNNDVLISHKAIDISAIGLASKLLQLSPQDVSIKLSVDALKKAKRSAWVDIDLGSSITGPEGVDYQLTPSTVRIKKR